MRHEYAVPAFSVLALLLVGCATPPTVHYKRLPSNGSAPTYVKAGKGSVDRPGTEHPADPDDGEFTFALPVSSVVLSIPDSAAKTATQQKSQLDHDLAVRAAAIAKMRHLPTPTVHPATASTPLAVTQNQPFNDAAQGSCSQPAPGVTDGLEAHAWIRCLNGVQSTTAPHPDLDYIYAARPADSLMLQVTTGDNPLQITTVKSNWTNTSAATMTRVGQEAAIGWGLYGPIGATVVVLAGEIATAAGKPHVQSQQQNQMASLSWDDVEASHYLCDGQVKSSPSAALDKARLLLPVALDLDKSLPDGKGCWHRFPQGDEKYTNSGWLYRVLEEQPTRQGAASPGEPQLIPPALDARKPGATLDKLDLVDGSESPTGLPPEDTKEAWFPTSACHAVRVQITYWTEIAAANKGVAMKERQEAPAKTGAESADVTSMAMPNYDITSTKELHVVIADPRYIQKMRLTEGTRTITMRLCGATAIGVAAANVAQADVSAAAGMVKAIRDAQQSWDKDHAKK